MRKLIRVMCLMLCMLVMFSFVSCKDDSKDKGKTAETTAETQREEKPFVPTTAKELYDKIDETMDALESYEADISGQLDYYYFGNKITCTMDGKGIEAGVNTDKIYFYEAITMDMKFEAMGLTEKITKLKAYNDGKYFVVNEGESVFQKMYSEMTKDDFLKYQEDTNSGDIDYDDCKNAEFVHNEDGTWTINFSGYTKKTVDMFVETLGVDEEMFGVDVSDMEISITADAQFRATNITMRIIFDVADGAAEVPLFVEIIDYSKYNEATPVTAVLEVEGYTKVEDIRLLNDIDKMFEDLENSEKCTIDIDLSNEFKVDGAVTETTTEKLTIEYGKDNGSFYYNVAAESGGAKAVSSYKNGVEFITQDGQSQSYQITEEVAKEYISAYIRYAKYDDSYVSDIQKTGEGVYVLTVGYPDTSTFDQLFAMMGATTEGVSQTITVTVKEGKIVKLEEMLYGEGNFVSDDGATHKISYSCKAVVTYTQTAGAGSNI